MICHAERSTLGTSQDPTMPYYTKLGKIPSKRHIQFRRPDGKLYAEEVFGT